MAIILRSGRRAIPVRDASSQQFQAIQQAACSIGRVELE